MRDGEAGDAAADDRDFFVVAAIGREHALIAAGVVSGGAAAFRAEFIGDEAFEGADGDGGIDIAAAAVDFAGGAADASADGGKRIGSAGDFVSVFVSALGDGGDVAAGVGVDGTGVLTLHHPDPVIRALNRFELIPLIGH